jgi:hypothetical protein
VVSPCSGDLVDERGQRAGIFGDVHDREVGDDAAPDQRQEGQPDGDELAEGQCRRCGDQPRIVAVRPPDGQHRLGRGDDTGERDREMAEFGYHRRYAPVPAASKIPILSGALAGAMLILPPSLVLPNAWCHLPIHSEGCLGFEA